MILTCRLGGRGWQLHLHENLQDILGILNLNAQAHFVLIVLLALACHTLSSLITIEDCRGQKSEHASLNLHGPNWMDYLLEVDESIQVLLCHGVVACIDLAKQKAPPS